MSVSVPAESVVKLVSAVVAPTAASNVVAPDALTVKVLFPSTALEKVTSVAVSVLLPETVALSR